MALNFERDKDRTCLLTFQKLHEDVHPWAFSHGSIEWDDSGRAQSSTGHQLLCPKYLEPYLEDPVARVRVTGAGWGTVGVLCTETDDSLSADAQAKWDQVGGPARPLGTKLNPCMIPWCQTPVPQS